MASSPVAAEVRVVGAAITPEQALVVARAPGVVVGEADGPAAEGRHVLDQDVHVVLVDGELEFVPVVVFVFVCIGDIAVAEVNGEGLIAGGLGLYDLHAVFQFAVLARGLHLALFSVVGAAV